MPKGKVERRLKFNSDNVETLPAPAMPDKVTDETKRGGYRLVGAAQWDYWDNSRKSPRGFGVRVSYGGTRTYFQLYALDGVKKRYKIGPVASVRLEKAREHAHDIVQRVSLGEDPQKKRQDARKVVTFGQLADEFVEHYAEEVKKSYKNDKQAIKHNLKPAFGNLKATRVTRDHIEDLADEMVKRGAPIAANRTIETFRAIYNWATVGIRSRNNGILYRRKPRLNMENPALRLGKRAPEKKRTNFLNIDQLAAYWNALDRPWANRSHQVAVNLQKARHLLVQRFGEMSQMRWNQIADGWWTLPAEFTKTGVMHRLPITPPLQKILDEQAAMGLCDTYVFPKVRGGEPINRTQYTEVHNEVCRQIGVTGYRAHDSLRTMTTLLSSSDIGLGLSDDEIEHIRHHKDGSTTGIYNENKYDGEKRQNLTRWQDWLLSKVEQHRGGNVERLKERRA